MESTVTDPVRSSSPPVVMAPRADGFEVVWELNAPARGWVELRPAGGEEPWRAVACDDHGFVPQGETVLRVRVTGLAPGREYLVRTVTVARDSGGDAADEASPAPREVSSNRSVRTLDPSAPSSTFVAWNDTHQQVDTLHRLDEMTPRRYVDVWVWNGDVCDRWNTPAEIRSTILSPAGLDVTDGRPMAFSWGNHDVRGHHAYQVPEVVATPNGLPYYSLRFGPIAALVLSTGEDKPDHHPSFGGRVAFRDLRERQAAWLAEEIRRPGIADAPYRLVFCHMPLRWHTEPELTEEDYQEGRFDHVSLTSRSLWHEALVSWGAQLVISGHTHRSAYLPPTPQFPYAQLVGGGKRPEEATWIEGTADSEGLTVLARNLLDGSLAHQATFTPLG